MERSHQEKLKNIVGSDNTLFDKESLLCYSYDATPDVPQNIPAAYVTPTSTAQVQEVVQFCRDNNLAIYPRGSGTNLSGGTVPLKEGIIMGMVKLNKILEVDPENLTATVQPGVIIQDLNKEITPHGLLYPPDPGTVATATMGGSVAECAGGLRGLKYGVTKHYIMGLEVVLANGKVMRCGGKTVKNVTAYDMVKLFVGSEGTLGIITELTVKLIPAPETRATFMASYKNLDDAASTITEIIGGKVIPATLEILDNVTIRTVENYASVGLPTDAEAILLIEVDGIPEVVEKEARIVTEACTNNNGELKKAETAAERDSLWSARRAALPALAQVRPTTILEDATVPRSKIPDMLRALKEIAERHNITIGTFGHAGDGNLHPTILTDERDTEEMKRVHKAIDDIFASALELGGTLSGEHGVGIGKKKYLESEFGEAGLEALKAVKGALDPENLFNPGKIIDLDEKE